MLTYNNVPILVAAQSKARVGLWALACKNCEFETRQGHGSLFVVSVVFSHSLRYGWVCGRLLARIASLKPVRGTEVCLW
jgi:hypothetical protein